LPPAHRSPRYCFSPFSPRPISPAAARNLGARLASGEYLLFLDADCIAAPDLVERAFKAEAPNRLWVADITYIPTWSGFLYLAIVLDVFSRRIVGWSMSLTLHTDVVLAALNMALAVRKPKSVIHHSDQGSQYTSIAFGARCREAGVRPSMGSVGDAYDNAMAESFFATLECELLDRRRFKTQAEARMALFAFIEGFYNPRRRHSALGYLSPTAFERRNAIMGQKRSTPSPGEPNHAAVLAPIKHKPSRARKTRALDRDCARRQSLRMGRDEGTGSAGAEPRNCIDKEDDAPTANQLH
jgi:transposase InsO family protein